MRMHEPLSPTSPATFQPALQVADAQAAYLAGAGDIAAAARSLLAVAAARSAGRCGGQQRGIAAAHGRPAADHAGSGPLSIADKQIFFANDETALWLTRQLQMSPANGSGRGAAARRFHLGGGGARSGAGRTFCAGTGAGRRHRQRRRQRVCRLPERRHPHATDAGAGATAVGSTGSHRRAGRSGTPFVPLWPAGDRGQQQSRQRLGCAVADGAGNWSATGFPREPCRSLPHHWMRPIRHWRWLQPACAPHRLTGCASSRFVA
jgi:hypothetical protein